MILCIPSWACSVMILSENLWWTYKRGLSIETRNFAEHPRDFIFQATRRRTLASIIWWRLRSASTTQGTMGPSRIKTTLNPHRHPRRRRHTSRSALQVSWMIWFRCIDNTVKNNTRLAHRKHPVTADCAGLFRNITNSYNEWDLSTSHWSYLSFQLDHARVHSFIDAASASVVLTTLV